MFQRHHRAYLGDALSTFCGMPFLQDHQGLFAMMNRRQVRCSHHQYFDLSVLPNSRNNHP